MRRRRLHTWGLILACIAVTVPSTAQHQFEYRQQLSRADGLPSDNVICITQDDEGFMWLGTSAGLVRFDGSVFSTYSNVPADSTTIADDRILDVEPDGNKLWIATQAGISVLDLNTDQVTNHYLDTGGNKLRAGQPGAGGASMVYKDRLGTIWISGREQRDFGWCRYLPDEDLFDCKQISPDALDPEVLSPAGINNVLSLHLDNQLDSILWVGTWVGLIRYNTIDDTYRHYYFPSEPKNFQLSLNKFRRMWQMPDGRLLVGSWAGGLNIFDPIEETFVPAPYSNANMPDAFFQSIREILPKSDTEVWVTLFKSLIAYDFVEERITLRLNSDFASKEIYGADFIDHNGRIWSRLYGAHIFDPALQQFVHAPYEELNPNGEGFTYDVLDDPDRGRLTIVARDCDALYHYYPADDRWSSTPFPSAISSVRRFEGNNALFIDDGEMIVSAFHEIFSYDPSTERMRLLDVKLPVSLKAFDNVHKDQKGRLWFGTQNDGVIGWDPSDNDIITLTDQLFINSIPGATDIELIDSQNRMWLTCKGKAFLYDIDIQEVVQLCDLLRTSCDISDADDGLDGRIWLTRSDGREVVIVSGKGSDLKVDTILTVGDRKSPMFDLHRTDDGKMWGFYIDKLLQVDPHSMSMEEFSTHYLRDFQDIVTTHLVRGYHLVIGLANAIVLIDLRKIRKNTEQPQPYISWIDVQEDRLQTDIVARQIDHLRLKHDENYFSLEFSALGYTLSDETRFQYRLLGFQNEWRDAADRRFANYTNVPSGDYTFELRAFNSEGRLSQSWVILPITIRKHWTELWAVRIAAFLALATLIYVIYRVREAQIRKEEKLKNEFKMQLADVEMTALRAQMNPHFIFNCLNSIENFVIKNEAAKASVYLNDFARLIRLILQNSGSKSIPLEDELEALELYMKMESLRFQNQFEYRIECANVEPSNVEIPPLVLQPYVENAIWHGLVPKEGIGHLLVRISQDGDVLHCVIEDDGIGRQRSAKQKKKHKNKKRSMGLAITRDRIELLNAVYNMNTKIEIEDLVDAQGNPCGTRVSLNIPV